MDVSSIKFEQKRMIMVRQDGSTKVISLSQVVLWGFGAGYVIGTVAMSVCLLLLR